MRSLPHPPSAAVYNTPSKMMKSLMVIFWVSLCTTIDHYICPYIHRSNLSIIELISVTSLGSFQWLIFGVSLYSVQMLLCHVIIWLLMHRYTHTLYILSSEYTLFHLFLKLFLYISFSQSFSSKLSFHI